MDSRTVFRILFAIILVLGLIAVGVYIYNAGVAQGLVAGGTLADPDGGVRPYPYYAPFYRPWGFGFFPFGWIFPLFFFLLLFWAIRGLFFRSWYRRGPGFWGGDRGQWPQDVPPMVEEWHRKLHETQSGPSPQRE